MKRYKAIVVEDEALARNALMDMIKRVPWLECCAVAETGREACEVIDKHHPDVVFLDIRIPDGSGLEVLNKIHATPFIVFTTAHIDFAVDAFDHGAVDYLVKPFGRARFGLCLDRIKERLDSLDDRDPIAVMNRIFVQNNQVVTPLDLKTVLYFEAARDYVVATTGSENHILSITLQDLESKLDPDIFARVHRSFIVNLQLIQKMERYDERRISIQFADGKQIIASRSGSSKLRRLFV